MKILVAQNPEFPQTCVSFQACRGCSTKFPWTEMCGGPSTVLLMNDIKR